ncbi:V-type ATP synthase subunit C [Halalkalicoccus jeotgali]|uniref:A-type ATP synthase subunit C n=1 Tax=Halalkalicoccus jeotgali (strain DSM 18796 / CECT 7217 / JCM 14584 / KCTC 4019 / B3) TaxID=795797 RepID=D8J5W8_HALJB|nr:V-type ATP synthase subunit C [Halalkalicoccus jeotgali]ADJ13774.1 V-type ATP synthase subunit C [Halalkalicoccus jeotgali B3]ELY34180.1 V-type ATP synthase subunit C [Halalkalicoccus jeotgali B3]
MSPRTRTIGSSNPEYVNARVRARRAALFDEEEYRKLVRMGPSEIARFMEETEYESEINALGARHSGVDLIEYALHANLAKHFDDLLDWAEGRLYEFIANYLRKFDAWNVKTVIRGIYADANQETIEADLIRAGELSDREVDRLLEARSIEDVVDQLQGTIFGEPLEAAYEDYEATNTLVPLENAVDRTYYEHILDNVGSVSGEADDPVTRYVEFLQAEIDFRNARNALRLARTGADIDPGEYFIDGGTLFERREMSTLVTNREELLARIEESTYGNRLDEALVGLRDAEGESLIAFEHALDTALSAYADRLANRYPMTIASVLSYILAKEREVDNIRAIARGREAGLTEEEITEELVIL